MTKHLVRLLFLIFLSVILLFAPLTSANNIPTPIGHVNDFAGIYSANFRTNLEQDLAAFEKETTVEIAVVTIKDLGGDSLENYAVKLFEQWKIGKKGKDNGVLLLIVKDERKVRIEVGYGLEPVINDSRAGEIIREEISPSFKEGNFEEGTKTALEKLKRYIRLGDKENLFNYKLDSSSPIGHIALIFFSGLFLFKKKPWKSKNFFVCLVNYFLVILGLFFLIVGSLMGSIVILGNLVGPNWTYNILEMGYLLLLIIASPLIYLFSYMARSKSIWLGGVVGAALGLYIGFASHSMTAVWIYGIPLSLLGLGLDWVLSKAYKVRKTSKKKEGWWYTFGGFSTGKGFGGFGGGRSGGGGASGSW